MKNIKWIANARNWWKIWSVQFFSLIALLSLLQQNWSEFKQFIPEQYQGTIISILAFAGALSRLVRQTSMSQPEDHVENPETPEQGE